MAFAKASHDNATIELMGKAYDAVLSDMKAANVNLAPGATTMIARRILAAVVDGERDLNRLFLTGFEAANALTPSIDFGSR